MSCEPERGCGFRKVGGLYLVSNGPVLHCGLLPRELPAKCPTCAGGIKQSIGFQWAQARLISHPEDALGCDLCQRSTPSPEADILPMLCPMVRLSQEPTLRVGLIWVGAQHYKGPEDFLNEAHQLGISRRIHAIPKGFEVRKSWVLLVHPGAMAPTPTPECPDCDGSGSPDSDPSSVCECIKARPGVFGIYRPTAIEQIVTESQAADCYFMDGLLERGITPVVLPDDDPDHQPSPRRTRTAAEHEVATA